MVRAVLHTITKPWQRTKVHACTQTTALRRSLHRARLYTVIIQDRKSHYRCITQHHHGVISGEIALAWRDPDTGEGVSDAVIEATYLHDVLWVPMDARLYFDGDRPLDFLAFPEASKLEYYAAGIALVTRQDAYMGLLHARHFGEFVSRDKHPDFRAAIDAHIHDARARLSDRTLQQVDADLTALRLFDVLSLLLCMTMPGGTRQPPPWLAPSPHLTRRGIEARWEGDALTLSRPCFDTPLLLGVPHRDIPREGSAEALRAAFQGAEFQHTVLTLRDASSTPPPDEPSPDDAPA